MTEPTNEQIDLIEKIFQYFFDVRCKRPHPKEVTNLTLFAKMFNTDRETAQFCINTISEIGDDEGILIAQKFGYGNWAIVRMDKIKCENFLNAGGFRKYFSKQTETTPTPNIHFENNYGQIVTNSRSASNQNSYVNTVDASDNKAEATRKKIGTLEKAALIATIVGTIIAILTYYHVFHF